MVGGAGLIYAVIIGMWALVLVPMWLRRHDEAQESKSVDRFSRAMGTLRRGDLPTREVLMPRRPDSARDAHVLVTGATAAESPAAAAAARRRRALAVLGGLLVVWVVLAVATPVPMWSLVLPVGLLAGFLVVARRQVALQTELRRRRERRETLSEAAREAEGRYTGSTARRGGRVVDPAPVRREEQAAPAARAPQHEVAATGTDSWSAVPTTLPTYVTAPRATRVPRVIDLTTPGSWSGAAMVEQARQSLSTDEVADTGMRVGSFEIAVPRDQHVRDTYVETIASNAPVSVPAPRPRRESTYDERYVADGHEIEALAAADDELDSLLGDPRTGLHGPTWRRAANG